MSDRSDRVLFVHAHPDDETISTGATIATLIDRGAQVTVVTCTRGELGEIIPPELQQLSPAALAAHRMTELDAALAALGVTDHRLLGQPGARWGGRSPRHYLDSGMQWGAKGAEPLNPVHPDSLTAAELGEVAADLAAVIMEVQPDVVISYAADGGYGHPDHIRAHEAARAAAEVLGVAFYVIDSGSKRGPVVVDPAPVLDRKRRALQAHRTQVTVAGDQFSLSSGPPRPIAALESFTRLRPVGTAFSDHSLPSRIAALLLAVLVGALSGGILTVVHQATVVLGTLTIPWGLIAAIAIVTALVVGMRLVFQTRLMAAAASLGVLGASALLAMQSRGGSVLVPNNLAGYAWVFAPVLIIGITLAWPRLPSASTRADDRTQGARDRIEIPAAKGPDPQ